jgi:DNA-binding transcriptional regulator YiaG
MQTFHHPLLRWLDTRRYHWRAFTMTPSMIKFIRTDLGLSQAELAQRLGLSIKNGDRLIRRWESGETSITGPASVALEYMHRYGLLQNEH